MNFCEHEHVSLSNQTFWVEYMMVWPAHIYTHMVCGLFIHTLYIFTEARAHQTQTNRNVLSISEQMKKQVRGQKNILFWQTGRTSISLCLHGQIYVFNVCHGNHSGPTDYQKV